MKNELLVQNSLINIKQMNQEKSRYEMNPSKYIIVNDDFPQTNEQASANQASTPEYYPNINMDERALQLEKNARNAIRGQRNSGQVYALDQNVYYGRENPKLFISDLHKDSKMVDIALGDLTQTFPSSKNLRNLQAKLIKLTNSSKINTSINGIYDKDNKAYYDPEQQMKEEKIQYLTRRIAEMDASLNQNNKLDFPEEKVSSPQIQNHQNNDREIHNKFVVDSYFYQVNKNQLANGTIDKTVPADGLLVKSKYIDNDKGVYATAESIGEILGNKYVKDAPSQNLELITTHDNKKDKIYHYQEDGKILYSDQAISHKVVNQALGKANTHGIHVVARLEGHSDSQDANTESNEADRKANGKDSTTNAVTSSTVVPPKAEVTPPKIESVKPAANVQATPVVNAEKNTAVVTKENKPAEKKLENSPKDNLKIQEPAKVQKF